MRHTTIVFATALAAIGFSGCQMEREVKSEVRVKGPFDPYDPDVKHVSRETKLKERIEADPKDVQGWFELGEYYESSMRPIDAVNAYERGNALLEPGRYTGGHYLLAKVYLRLQEWERSIAHLNQIFQLEPKDPKSACLNQHFREAHYLRGAIYYLNKQWKPAKKEFFRFLEIGGEEARVEEFLEDIHNQGE